MALKVNYKIFSPFLLNTYNKTINRKKLKHILGRGGWKNLLVTQKAAENVSVIQSSDDLPQRLV